jgi:hypothetical protein
LAAVLPAETWTVTSPDLTRSEIYAFEGELQLSVPLTDLYIGATGAELCPLENAGLITLYNGTGSKVYRGFVELSLQSNAYRVLLYLTMDQYVMGVVPKEMSYSWPLEALKAQAIIARTWGEANRGQSNWDRDRHRNLGDSHLGSGDFSGTLGGFGNQTFGSSEHDHYRNWRDREMAKLDKDYDDYCREREQQFNQDFDSWRRNRSSQSQSKADLGTSSNAGVGTTTASMTGTAGSGSAIGSATGTGGSIQSDTTGSTETADAGTGRSSSRSRS